MDIERLTAKQRSFYEELRSFIERNGEAPTIAEFMKIRKLASPRAVTQYLDILERKGLIVRERYGTRGIKLRNSHIEQEFKTVLVPVIASAGCDNVSVLAEQNFNDYICVSSELLKGRPKERVVSIRAIGASMDEAGVNDGDYVLVEHTEAVESDDLVVAVIDGFAVIKKISFANNAVILSPVSSDPKYKPIILRRDFRIFGKVIDIIRMPQKGDLEVVPIYT
ncbi:MAG: transcriptional repressor LexA [Patescibacteria group bacterium]